MNELMKRLQNSHSSSEAQFALHYSISHCWSDFSFHQPSLHELERQWGFSSAVTPANCSRSVCSSLLRRPLSYPACLVLCAMRNCICCADSHQQRASSSFDGVTALHNFDGVAVSSSSSSSASPSSASSSCAAADSCSFSAIASCLRRKRLSLFGPPRRFDTGHGFALLRDY